MVMPLIDRLLDRLLGERVDNAVQRALAEHRGKLANELLYEHRVHGDPARLHIHSTAVVNNALFNVSAGDITVEEFAFFGHDVSLLTGTHDFTKFGRERQITFPKSGRDVIVKRGVWLASEVVVFGPCVIGEHAVVGGGSLVTGDVEPYTVVAGRPAKPLRTLEHGGG